MKKLLLVTNYDLEDGGLMGASFTLEVPLQCSTFADAIQYCLPRLSSKEIVNFIIENDFIEEELLTSDEYDVCAKVAFEFESLTYTSYSLDYNFKREDGEIHTHTKSLDFIELFE